MVWNRYTERHSNANMDAFAMHTRSDSFYGSGWHGTGSKLIDRPTDLSSAIKHKLETEPASVHVCVCVRMCPSFRLPETLCSGKSMRTASHTQNQFFIFIRNPGWLAVASPLSLVAVIRDGERCASHSVFPNAEEIH